MVFKKESLLIIWKMGWLPHLITQRRNATKTNLKGLIHNYDWWKKRSGQIETSFPLERMWWCLFKFISQAQFRDKAQLSRKKLKNLVIYIYIISIWASLLYNSKRDWACTIEAMGHGVYSEGICMWWRPV